MIWYCPNCLFASKIMLLRGIEYDAIIDISIDQLCNAKEVTFSRFKVLNDCYFIVRSSEKVYEDRILYTTERINYKPFVEKRQLRNIS